jgi:hypothetical protein
MSYLGKIISPQSKTYLPALKNLSPRFSFDRSKLHFINEKKIFSFLKTVFSIS